ncbi:MAG: hypothetical protein MUF18_12525 [Fimbriiglobus sp.]|jgi:hypothetical protein|nr:hypothetical protein [Fimbriiglobus sp.]
MDQTVATFAALLTTDAPLTPADVQRRASNLLPILVARSGMHWLALPEPPNGTGEKLVVGIASWSAHDLSLLDELNAFAESHPGIRIGVFDVDRVGGEFERFIPGIGPVFHSPIVGRWSGGVVVEKGTGHDGRQILNRLLAQLSAAA